MNKVTLSVAALAAIAVPVQVQAADQTREQLINEVNAYIDEAKALIETYKDVKGVETDPDSYLSKINTVKADFKAWYENPTNANTAIDAQSWKARARAVVDLAAAAQKPYDVKNGLLENWTAANSAYTTAQNNLNVYNVAASMDFYNKKLPVLQAYMNNAITEDIPGLTALQTKINAYDPAGAASTLIDDAAGIRAQLAGIKAALEFEFSSENLKAAFNANNNENAYQAIVTQVANANAAIDNVFNQIRDLYPQESVYGDWYKEAYDELGKWRQEVARVEQYNKQCHEAGTALRDDDKALEKYRKTHTGNFTLQRYKGLGEMNYSQLSVTTRDPEHRRLIQVTIPDDDEAQDKVDLFLGKDADRRKEWIENNIDFNTTDTFTKEVRKNEK